MNRRHDKLGIKQTIQKHWMDYVVKMMLAGLKEKEIRAELDEFLAQEKPYSGQVPKTHSFAKTILASWFAPDKDLIPFRDHALSLVRHENPRNWLPYHWAVISASYPFWFNVAKQTGRLFNLQDQIKQSQVFSRLKEQYGDRETVTRNARYAIRSFVAWGVLEDSKGKGCYEQSKPMGISDPNLTILLYEAALYTDKEGKSVLGLLKNNPAFFPFQLLVLTGNYISQQSNNIDVVRYGLDDELLKLRDK
ncbi:hypothetical protein JWG39_00680 [Desulforhopalus vacuolatus]|uniref:hypothetical protein n=1 Tax=Desulforhopalus vacuolatus TaxID=40414 RepID=UPI0019629C4D|nr:hypothetical protein [Desulforhopalus vacuolatus]MBM9518330.1 hypothetical protein [Desulforhopalus vacuolatus]